MHHHLFCSSVVRPSHYYIALITTRRSSIITKQQYYPQRRRRRRELQVVLRSYYRSVLITGGANGLGEAIALRLLREQEPERERNHVAAAGGGGDDDDGNGNGNGNGTGDLLFTHVTIADIDREAGRRLQDKYPNRVLYVHTDVSQPEDVAHAVQVAAQQQQQQQLYHDHHDLSSSSGSGTNQKKREKPQQQKQQQQQQQKQQQHQGRLHAIVNNAGIVGPQQSYADYDIQEWKRVIDINLNGVFYGLKYGLAQMMAQIAQDKQQQQQEEEEEEKSKGGSRRITKSDPNYAIVNIASTAGARGIPNLGPYTAAKWAINGMTQAAAVEYAPHHIRINAIAPTTTETRMIQQFVASSADPDRMTDQLLSMNALPGFPQPDDVAGACAFLLSQDARYITGHTLPVDAGALARLVV